MSKNHVLEKSKLGSGLGLELGLARLGLGLGFGLGLSQQYLTFIFHSNKFRFL